MSRDWHGIQYAYRRVDGATATSVRALTPRGEAVPLDRDGVRAAWGELDGEALTIVEDVRREARATPTRDALAFEAWAALLEETVARLAVVAMSPVLALGGGLDAAAVAVAWRQSGAAMPAVVTLATGLWDYDEVDAARDTARALGVGCDVVEIAAPRLVARAPAAAIAAETPFYDLHPVHRLVLTDACGPGATLVTGDGADAVFAHRADLDYVPYVVALGRASGVVTASPFFDDALLAATPLDPTKQHLRRYLRAHGLGALASRPKRARSLPALDVSSILHAARITRLAARLGRPADLTTHRARVGWATLDALVSHLEAD